MSNEALSYADMATMPVEKWPKSALQALYHAVTGKTENYSKPLRGDVLITSADIDRLYYTIEQQIEHYTVLASPTVTVVVKASNSKTTQYSSWERFKALQVNTTEITSEITIKVEFVVTLPNTDTPQRCVINVLLDSALPVMQSRVQNSPAEDPFEHFFFIGHDWLTVKISIDFVDFLIARLFTSIVEEWFGTLEKIPKPKLNTYLIRNIPVINDVMKVSGQLGFALYLAGYAYFSSLSVSNLETIVYALAIAIAVWALFRILTTIFIKYFFRRISSNVFPSVIVLTEADRKTYDSLIKLRNSSTTTAFGVVGTVFLGMTINLVSSYVYAVWNTTG